MRKKKPKIDPMLQDDGGGYIVSPIQKPEIDDLEKIERIGDKSDSNKNIITIPVKREVPKESYDIKDIEDKTLGENKDEISEKLEKKFKEDGYTLIICEKPQAAMKVAYALADTSPIRGSLSGIPYFELQHKDKKIIIVSAVGHMFGLVEKAQTKDWPVFDVKWQPTASYVSRYIRVIESFCRNASDFVLACDYDIEGELIGFNALRFICNRTEAKRMKFSTLTKYELVDSYDNAMPHIDYGQAYAGETRHYLDWFYGINLSRALMQAIKAAGAFKILSIGRVQGPALALVVNKEKEIMNFKSETYWQVFLLLNEVELKCTKDIFDKKEAENLLKLKGKFIEVKTEKEKRSLWPFPPFDLTSLQLESYKLFGFSPAQTLAIAQSLYLRGLISYPRTSSQKLPFSLGLGRIIEKLSTRYPDLVKVIKRSKPIEGRKTDPAHPAIFPTGEFSEKIKPSEKQIYELIVKRFISCFAEPALIEDKKITGEINNYTFTINGHKILKKSWLEIYPYRLEEKDIPDLNGKQEIKDTRLEEKQTQPPRRYSSASLVSELEKRELGTKTTRATIVDTLYKRGYVIGRQIQATHLGISVTDSLEKNCPLILDEKLTRDFEKEMEKLQEEKSKEDMLKKENKILDDAKKLLLKISKDFKTHEMEIGKELAEAHFETKKKEEQDNTLFTCPVCGKGNLRILRSHRGKRFAGCNKYPECKTTFSLPQMGMIKISDKKCECGWQMLMLISRGRPPWNFCLNPECPVKKAKEERKIEREKVREEKKKEKAKKARARATKARKKEALKKAKELKKKLKQS